MLIGDRKNSNCFWNQMQEGCCYPIYQAILQWIPTGYHLIQFNSDTVYHEWKQIPQDKGSVWWDCLLLQMSATRTRLWPVLLTNWLQIGFSQFPPCIWLIRKVTHGTQRNILLMFLGLLITYMIKDIDQHKMKRCIGHSLEGSWVQEVLFTRSWCIPSPSLWKCSLRKI